MTRNPTVRIIDDRGRPPHTPADPVEWAVSELVSALAGAGALPARGDGDGIAVRLVDSRTPLLPESYRIRREPSSIVVEAGDARGHVYPLLDLADVVRHADDPVGALRAVPEEQGAPANRLRSMTRIFSSRAEDSGWFHDRSFWDGYLTELALHRFNRFSFGVGPGNDFTIDLKVRDSYLYFPYPYLLDVPGYDVRVAGVGADERARNLASLRHIAEATARRGLDFHLGLWNHAYEYDPDDPAAPLRISGLDPSNHAEYCRDALAELLQAVPEVRGVTFRVHVEGGVREPTHNFWRVVLSRLDEFGHLDVVDFHAKGVGEDLVRTSRSVGKRTILSAKYWGEHMGLPYHQASIRELDRTGRHARGDENTRRGLAVGVGPGAKGWEETSRRSFTRYGYADFLRADRPYEFMFRIWPGTQRFLSQGDPAAAAAIGREAGFGGSVGVEWFDMMTFKGRKDSGEQGGRELYRDPALQLGGQDWTKHRYAYRLWGRLAYDPATSPDVWRRFLRTEHGAASDAVERALAVASRVLPLVFVTHGPSTACAMYWPEMYTDVPIAPVPPLEVNPYADRGWPPDLRFDSLPPHTFGSVGSLDPALFYGVEEFADAVVAGERTGRFTPLEVAELFEGLADDADRSLTEAREVLGDAAAPAFRRAAWDVEILAHVARFFADKFRSATWFALYTRVGDDADRRAALTAYREARAHWAHAADSGRVYRDDLRFGAADYQRGHWADRLPAIDAHIAAMERAVASVTAGSATVDRRLLARRRPAPPLTHTPPATFRPGAPLLLTLHGAGGLRVTLRYRHVNQAESYRELVMTRGYGGWSGEISASYTDSPYDLQYFFDVHAGGVDAWLCPGLGDDLTHRPYHVVTAER